METSKALSEQFTFYEEGICYLKLCLDITLYFEDSLFNHASEVIQFYKNCLEIIGPNIKYYQTENMGKARKITKKAPDALPLWFEGGSGKRPIIMLFLESGSTSDDVSDQAFSMRADEIDDNGHLRLMLPVATIENSVEDFISLAKSLANLVHFSSGHAGVAINRHIPGKGDYAGEARAKMYIISQRYPGIDLNDLSGTSQYVRFGIKCVNWLTFINPVQCEELGGKDKITSKLGKDCIVHSLKHGLMIQAGPRPEIGDVNLGLTLPYYRCVGKVLKPIRMQEHSHFLASDEEITMRWLARFDE